jgi:hypothetical protein
VAPAPTPAVVAFDDSITTQMLPDVATYFWCGDHITLVHVNFTSTTVRPEMLVITSPTLGLFGWPGLGINAAGGSSHVFSTTYTSDFGSHTIQTSCTHYLSTQACIDAHRNAVMRMQEAFPHV